MNSLSQKPGIYKITCTPNGKIYIGSSVNIMRRWQAHKSFLNNNLHTNRYLQSAWNKYGESAFIFEIVERCLPDMLENREQFWLDTLRPYDRSIGFNLAKFSDAPRRGRIGTMRGKSVSPETKMKLRTINLGKRHSQETRAKMSVSQKGKKMRPESIAKTVAALEKDWIVTDPSGNEMLIKNLSRHCRENNLNHGLMIAVAKGTRNHHHGWKCKYA